MVQQRKATTYGKSSRKPISNCSGFAQASEPTIDHAYPRQYDAEPSTTEDAVTKVAQGASRITSRLKAKGGISTELQSQSSSDHDKTENNIAIYRFPFSDESNNSGTSTSDAGSRKRRKITPTSDEPLTSVVFDDKSLQRHIAAEVRLELSTSFDFTSKAPASSSIPLTSGRGKSYVTQPKKSSLTKSRSAASVNRSALSSTCSPKTPKPKFVPAKQIVSPQYRHNRVPTQSPASYKSRGLKDGSPKSKENSLTPPKDSTLSALSPRISSVNEHSEIELDLAPITPIGPRGGADVVTTPKQRELWGKLLSNDTQVASPSMLRLPGLRIADQEVHSENPTSRSQMQANGRATKVETRARSARLVDFLITSDRESTSPRTGYSEESDSSGAEQSKSFHSEASINDDILTMQTSPSAGSQTKHLPIDGSGPGPSSQPLSALQGPPKITYIRERTHLEDGDLRDAAVLDVPLVPESGFQRKRQLGSSAIAQLKGDPGKNIYNASDDILDPQEGAMRSIHELREAGGNTRIVGELEAILDDLDERLGSSISARRSSLMSLNSKLLEASTCRMLVDQGLESRLLAQVTFGHDIIERSLLVAAILQVLFHTTSAVFLSQPNKARTTNLFVGLLNHTEDLAKEAKLRETNMSKFAQSGFLDFCSAFLRSPMWRASKPPVLSGQIMALQGLELLVHQAHESGSSAEILSADAVICIAQNALPSGATPQPLTTISKICLELAVSILEFSALSHAADIRGLEWSDPTIERIRDIFPTIANSSSYEFGNLRTLTLRLYLNLTNTNPPLCETFSKPSLVRAIFETMCLQFGQLSEPDTHDRDSSLLDDLILSLGCLINLAESSDAMRQLVMDLKAQDDTFLEALLQLFLKKRGNAAEVKSSSVPIASVLLTI